MTDESPSKYAADILPEQAWEWVQRGEAVLVDVRSDAEREWVGAVPGALAVPLKQWPGMAMNPDFDATLLAQVPVGSKKLLMLCRSGVRSMAAAERATALGYEAYNVLEGFEGPLDENGHRGTLGGWRKRGLPWVQR
ncbi:sulfurtransferase [Lampropedia cohaerens]|uniref:Sulfurtransferase n=1 Tax=Lampropedia cohaerens TaxID=1610491 RepID=A0A0U1PXB4_9BURK|nr:rhodanese-like domain-containing protein [Lampropedia cohaerens]KKW67067.1 sulfurtransferase [Lampropedia cohaerens]